MKLRDVQRGESMELIIGMAGGVVIGVCLMSLFGLNDRK